MIERNEMSCDVDVIVMFGTHSVSHPPTHIIFYKEAICKLTGNPVIAHHARTHLSAADWGDRHMLG